MKHIARKRFGQHFLTDSAVIDRIVDAIDPRPGEALVEIGPGLGAMTDPLVARCGALTVITRLPSGTHALASALSSSRVIVGTNRLYRAFS